MYKKLSMLIDKKGLTLLELLIVVAVLGILAGALIPNFQGVIADAKNSAAKADLRLLKIALYLYENDFGEIPEDVGPYGTGQLEEAFENWDSLFRMVPRIPNDPWGKTTGDQQFRDKYRYKAFNAQNPDQHNTFVIYSVGKNGKSDIGSVSDDRITLNTNCDDIIATNARWINGSTTGDIL
ncbi:MAG TPA: prepilin-type N-terminal cleavage/methylation domain-containing protein [Candidatus Omnitrophica bacterium]|nr:prepilin-type N-terminal cleavage/methylation domain-containing protein [Candidatus Omnitrophota bacterium]